MSGNTGAAAVFRPAPNFFAPKPSRYGYGGWRPRLESNQHSTV